MSFLLLDRIFSYFGNNEARKDTYKDTFSSGLNSGRGIQERFQRICALEYDTYIAPYIDDFSKNFVSIDDLPLELLGLVEQELKIEFMQVAPEEIRRKAIKFHTSLVGVKGSKKGFRSFFNLIGINDFTLELRNTRFTLDSSETLDSPIRRLDSKCSCDLLTVDIDTSGLDNATRLLSSQLVPSIVEWLLPWNIELDKALYYDLLLVSNKSGTNQIVFTGTAQAVIDWGDGTVESFDTSLGTASHIYTSTDSREIAITFDNPDLISKVEYEDSGVSYFYIKRTLLNNDTDFELDLEGNSVDNTSIERIFVDLFNVSDKLETNLVVIDLKGSGLTDINTDIRNKQAILLDEHNIELRIGGDFSRDYSLDFQQQ